VVQNQEQNGTQMTRKETGKSSIFGMLLRLYAFFLLIGSPIIWWFTSNLAPREGQNIYDYAHGEVYKATQYDVIQGHATLVFGWLAGVSLVIGVGWLGMRLICAALFAGDEEYKAWRESGGDPYFDSLAGPFNTDDDETRAAFFSENTGVAGRFQACPVCGWPLTLNNGLLCGNCGTYWDPAYNNGQGSWMRPPQPPTLPLELQ
jgi:hypothetical protein